MLGITVESKILDLDWSVCPEFNTKGMVLTMKELVIEVKVSPVASFSWRRRFNIRIEFFCFGLFLDLWHGLWQGGRHGLRFGLRLRLGLRLQLGLWLGLWSWRLAVFCLALCYKNWWRRRGLLLGWLLLRLWPAEDKHEADAAEDYQYNEHPPRERGSSSCQFLFTDQNQVVFRSNEVTRHNVLLADDETTALACQVVALAFEIFRCCNYLISFHFVASFRLPGLQLQPCSLRSCHCGRRRAAVGYHRKWQFWQVTPDDHTARSLLLESNKIASLLC
mmetsp:Transcript_81559/g.141707  ORF Transcript_81559/g.141707 Transcript_81559/m.141707 type:complete len:277 (+) Transcript_81559:183-1013(+)